MLWTIYIYRSFFLISDIGQVSIFCFLYSDISLNPTFIFSINKKSDIYALLNDNYIFSGTWISHAKGPSEDAKYVQED